MKKNAKLRIIVTSEMLEDIKRRAREHSMTMSSYCLRKINNPSEMQRIELLLKDILNRLEKSPSVK